MPEFSLRIDFRCVIAPQDSALSLSTFAASSKKVATGRAAVHDRLPPHEHYQRLGRKPEPPFIVAGVRNILSNVRCIGYDSQTCDRHGVAPGSLAVVNEEPDSPGRPYHTIRFANGRFTAEEFMPQRGVRDPQKSLEGSDWLISGTPVLWDCDEAELFDRIVTDAADVAHVWHLPRGNHPNATSESQSHWKQLHSLFMETLDSERNEAAGQIRQAASDLNVQRECDYLHSVWGVSASGELIIVIAHGQLEDVGEKARASGAKRAICVENGGSVALYHVLNDAEKPWEPIIRSPNLRPPGTAFVFFALADSSFSCLRVGNATSESAQ